MSISFKSDDDFQLGFKWEHQVIGKFSIAKIKLFKRDNS